MRNGKRRRGKQDNPTQSPRSSRPNPPTRHTWTVWDWLHLSLAIIVVTIVVLLIAYFVRVWWRHLESSSRSRVQALAMLTTALVPISSVACLLLGMRLAAIRINWFKADWMEAIRTTVSEVLRTGTEVADVRVYGARRLFTGMESKRSQEIDTPLLPWVDPQSPETIEIKATEVEEA
jgi:hypothetical protein